MAPRNENAIQTALSYFISQGWTRAQAAGIVANLHAESGLRPDAVGDGGAAYGIAQWHPDRQRRFVWFANKDIHGSTLEEQLAFVHAELNQWEKTAGDALRKCTTAAEAGACVSRMYERPADRDGDAAKRAELATSLAGEQPAAPIEDKSTTYQPTGERKQPMGALAIAGVFGEVLKALIPQVGKLFGGQKDAQNAQAIGTVFDTIVTATGQALPADLGKVGTAVQMMQADAKVKEDVTKAVVTEPSLMAILEVGGGVVKAREFDVEQQKQTEPFYKTSAVFWMSIIMLPMVYWLVGSLIAGGTIFKALSLAKDLGITIPSWVILILSLFGDVWQGETRSGGFNLIVGLVLGGICGVYYGISVTQAKQAAQAAQAAAAQKE